MPELSDKMTDYDFVIIGAGAAGIFAAIQAAKLGKKVGLVEINADALGGAWLQTGTIPSKTMRETLAAISNIQFHVGKAWVERMQSGLSAESLLKRAQKVSSEEEAVVRRYLSKNKISLIPGRAKLIDANTISVRAADLPERRVRFKSLLIATGSSPRRPAEIPFDGWRVVDSDQILRLDYLPQKMIIYGAGVIGCEYACIFNELGVQVSIFDSREEVMQMLDVEMTKQLRKIMESQGIEFCMSQTLDRIEVTSTGVKARFDNSSCEAQLFFFAAGRVSNTLNMGLEDVGVKTGDRGVIKVNEHFQTSIPHIYAAGDSIGPPALASTSAEQGRHAACHAFGDKPKPFPKVLPIGIYTIPEMSMVGKTEEELKKDGAPYVVGRAYFTEVARGYIRGDNHGLLKIIVCERTHKLLGVHVVGADAANLVHIGQSFMIFGASVQDIVQKMIFNYPTLAETYRIAAFNALNKIFKDGVFRDPPFQIDRTKPAA